MKDCNRKPNSECSVCSKKVYRRPNELTKLKNVFCSDVCYRKAKCLKNKKCKNCKESFKPAKRTSAFCSKSCANAGRSGIKYSKNSHWNGSRRRLELLQITFKFESCMIDGCEYHNTYDIHRFIPGKDGGKYELGNMFAICPNHHAEITRRIIKVDKINDSKLKIV